MKKIIISGCSYSCNTGTTPYSEILKTISNTEVKNISWPGQSNQSIIRHIRKEIDKGTSDTLFICQLTHLHRLNLYCTLNNKYIDFQPNFVNIIPEIKNDNIVFDIDIENPHRDTLRGIGTYGATKQIDTGLDENLYKELFNFYSQYLKYFYDDENSFYNLMDDVDDLSRLIESSGNEIMFLYWSHIIPNVDELRKRKFVNINGKYSLLNWSTKNNLLDGKTSHLGQKGHTKLSEIISKQINLKKNKII